MSTQASTALQSSCHCGAVRITIPQAPERVTNCNCSVCRRYGALWGYYAEPDVKIEAPEHGLHEYLRGERTIAFVRCAQCGCVTHWLPVARKTDRMGVNIRLFDPAHIGPVRIRLLDGADTEEVVGEIGPV